MSTAFVRQIIDFVGGVVRCMHYGFIQPNSNDTPHNTMQCISHFSVVSLSLSLSLHAYACAKKMQNLEIGKRLSCVLDFTRVYEYIAQRVWASEKFSRSSKT